MHCTMLQAPGKILDFFQSDFSLMYPSSLNCKYHLPQCQNISIIIVISLLSSPTSQMCHEFLQFSMILPSLIQAIHQLSNNSQLIKACHLENSTLQVHKNKIANSFQIWVFSFQAGYSNLPVTFHPSGWRRNSLRWVTHTRWSPFSSRLPSCSYFLLPLSFPCRVWS